MRPHDPGLAGALERVVDETADRGKARKVRVDELLRGLLGHADVLGERERRLPVEQRVVDDLRAPPQLVRVEAAVGPEHLQRRPVVDVLAGAERLDQRFFVGQVREHPQLDLRVVGGDQHVARARRRTRGGSRRPSSVRIGMFCRFGSELLRRPVAATAWLKQVWTRPGRRVHELRQRVDVGALQLVQAAPFENQPRQLVDERQLLEHLDGGRRRSRLAGLLERRQLQLLEQDLAELLRRVDVELLSGELEDARRIARQLLLDVLRLRGQRRAVDPDAGALDVGQHGQERHFQLAEHLRRASR